MFLVPSNPNYTYIFNSSSAKEDLNKVKKVRRKKNIYIFTFDKFLHVTHVIISEEVLAFSTVFKLFIKNRDRFENF